jgi:polar amino acid transport system substrate-binding protein/cystine transport system substrate-binding protein
LTFGLVVATNASAELADIQERGYAVFVMSGEYPPFSQPDEDGAMIGFDADVARELAARLGVEPRLQQAEFASIIGGVQAGVFDITVASHARTPERERAVDFIGPYYYSGAQLFVREDSEFESYEDLRDAGATIAVDLGGTNQQWLEDDGYPSIATYSGVQDSLQAVLSGRADAIFTSPIVGNLAISEQGLPLKAIGGLLFEENAWVTIAQNQPELKAAIEAALEEMREDGTLRDISERWIGADITTPPGE